MNTSLFSTGALIMTLFTSSINSAPETSKATFAGGCFWCMVAPFETIDGVEKVIAGYTGGSSVNPTYEEVCTGKSGHVEAVQVLYDPSRVTYGVLLDAFWRNVNPTDRGGQFADRGKQYATAIYYHDEPQKSTAEASRKTLEASAVFEDAIVTPILPAKRFYPAEAYHQEYHEKNPQAYKRYRDGSGRTPFLKRIWGDSPSKITPITTDINLGTYARPNDAALRKQLTKQQYDVAVCSATEPPFANEFWNNKREGLYVDIISGKPLFSSNDKFNSGTGWPSFTRTVDNGEVVEHLDTSHGMERIEVRSKTGDAHLGHLFNDGPAPTGMRYCINSASLRFIAKEDLAKEGYGEFVKLFGINAAAGDDR